MFTLRVKYLTICRMLRRLFSFFDFWTLYFLRSKLLSIEIWKWKIKNLYSAKSRSVFSKI